MNTILFCESINQAALVLMNPSFQIVCYTDVEHTVELICKNVDVVSVHSTSCKEIGEEWVTGIRDFSTPLRSGRNDTQTQRITYIVQGIGALSVGRDFIRNLNGRDSTLWSSLRFG